MMPRQLVTGMASVEEQTAALSFLFADTAPAERAALVAAELRSLATPDSSTWLYQSGEGSSPRGVLLARALPGRTVMIDRWRAPGADALLTQLVAAAVESAQASEMSLIQALLDPETATVTPFLAAGMQHVADLAYLSADVSTVPNPDFGTDWNVEPYTAAATERLKQIVTRSYENSLDCPALEGVRNVADVLQGYQSVGIFRPEGWSLISHRGRDAGCILLADHGSGTMELVYMALVPEARGHGGGKVLAAAACQIARRLQNHRVILAVDLANRPALKSYKSVGFTEWALRSVLMLPCKPTPSQPPHGPKVKDG